MKMMKISKIIGVMALLLPLLLFSCKSVKSSIKVNQKVDSAVVSNIQQRMDSMVNTNVQTETIIYQFRDTFVCDGTEVKQPPIKQIIKIKQVDKSEVKSLKESITDKEEKKVSQIEEKKVENITNTHFWTFLCGVLLGVILVIGFRVLLLYIFKR